MVKAGGQDEGDARPNGRCSRHHRFGRGWGQRVLAALADQPDCQKPGDDPSRAARRHLRHSYLARSITSQQQPQREASREPITGFLQGSRRLNLQRSDIEWGGRLYRSAALTSGRRLDGSRPGRLSESDRRMVRRRRGGAQEGASVSQNCRASRRGLSKGRI